MRIVCPNCGAQYEVDAALIPAPGRDVQCSNCGRGWFQAHSIETEAAADASVAPETRPEPAPEPAAQAEPEPAPEAEAPTARVSGESSDLEGGTTEPDLIDERSLEGAETPDEPERETIESEIARMIRTEREPESEPAPAAVPENEPEPEAHLETVSAPAPEDSAPASEAEPEVTGPAVDAGSDEAEPDAGSDRPARPLVDLTATPANPAAARHDPETLAVLREEAERELTERRREGGGLETQPDLGLDSAPPERPATQPARAAEEVAARKDLLPDIDEINSSLSPETTVAIANSLSGHEDTEATDRRRGFRLGFGTMVLAAALLIALYLAAPWLARTVPGAETFLVSYVDWANGVRDWIDEALAAGVDRLS